MSVETPSGVYDRIVLAYNPQSRHADETERQQAVAGEIGLPVELVQTEPGVQAMRSLLDEVLEPRDVLVVWGGDGGGSTAAQAMLGKEQPVVLLPGGNANDSYVMVNGAKTLPDIIRTGRLINLRPLEVGARTADLGEMERRAIGYFSIGAAANASRIIDQWKLRPPSGIRPPRIVREAKVCLDALATGPLFSMATDAASEPIQASDRTFARGNIMAKLGRTHANLAEPVFEDVTTIARGYGDAVRLMAKLGRGSLKGVMREAVQFCVFSEDGTPLSVQYDGEYDTVESGSELTVTISPRSYKTITTRL